MQRLIECIVFPVLEQKQLDYKRKIVQHQLLALRDSIVFNTYNHGIAPKPTRYLTLLLIIVMMPQKEYRHGTAFG